MMPRTVNYDEFQQEWRGFALMAKARLGLRRVDDKPRNPDKRRTLIMLDCLRVRRMFESGELEWTGPRQIRVRLFPEVIASPTTGDASPSMPASPESGCAT